MTNTSLFEKLWMRAGAVAARRSPPASRARAPSHEPRPRPEESPMRPALPTVLITALVAVASLLDLGAPAARAQGYYYNSAQGYSYSAPPGYSYPRYNYTTQPS